MFSRIVLVIVVTSVVSGLTACGGATPGDGSGRTSIVTSFYPLAYAAQQVGAERVSVTNLTPAGAEPHDLELTARDVQEVQEADLVVYLGGGFQPALEQALAGRTGRSLDLLEGRLTADPAAEMSVIDPHLWLDPASYAAMAQTIADELGEPAAAAGLVSRLRRLGREYEAGLADCRRREIVTSHAAFGFLAARFGLEQIPLTGVAPETEPSPKDLEQLVRRVESARATTVFAERLVSPELAATVAREAGASTAVLDPLEGLSDDRIAAGENYFTVMRDNLVSLRAALGCR